MASFKSKRNHSAQNMLLSYLGQLALLILITIFLHYFKVLNKSTVLSTLALPFILLIADFIRRSNQELINEVDISESNKIITFYLYNFWKGHTQRTESFKKIKMEIDPNYSEGLFSGSTFAIFFFKKVPGTFYISRGKDKFSLQTLHDLATSLNNITSCSTS